MNVPLPTYHRTLDIFRDLRLDDGDITIWRQLTGEDTVGYAIAVAMAEAEAGDEDAASLMRQFANMKAYRRLTCK